MSTEKLAKVGEIMNGFVRDRKIAGTRAEIMAALSPLKAEGKVDAIAWERLTKSLGLA